MRHLSWPFLALSVLLPALASAQAGKPPPNPLDPAQPAPQLQYRSVFEQYQKRSEESETPEKRWVGVNQQLMPADKPQHAPNGHDGAMGHMHGGH